MCLILHAYAVSSANHLNVPPGGSQEKRPWADNMKMHNIVHSVIRFLESVFILCRQRGKYRRTHMVLCFLLGRGRETTLDKSVLFNAMSQPHDSYD